jgi:hypothetical protein
MTVHTSSRREGKTSNLKHSRILIAAGEDVRENGFWGKHRYIMRQTSTLRDSSSRMERLCTPLPILGEHHCIQLGPLESLKPWYRTVPLREPSTTPAEAQPADSVKELK